MPRSVLLIDADVDCHHIVRTLLDEERIAFSGATDAREGIERARSERPSLIICEVFVPYRSRLRLPDALKQDEVAGLLPLLVWTTQAFQRERTQVEKLGAIWLPKPCRPIELRKVILSLLG